MKKLSLYGAITLISIVVRQFLLPNPFECFGDNSFLINWIAEPILQIITYCLVGFIYCKGAPAYGSLLYLIVYCLLIGILWIMGIFAYAWWWILIVIGTLIVLLVSTTFISNKINGG